MAAQMRALFNAPDKMEAGRLLKAALEAWRKERPKLAHWAEESIPESLTVFDFPAVHRIRLRTTHGLERYPPGIATTHPRGEHLPECCSLPAIELGAMRRDPCSEAEDSRYLNMTFLMEQKKEMLRLAA